MNYGRVSIWLFYEAWQLGAPPALGMNPYESWFGTVTLHPQLTVVFS